MKRAPKIDRKEKTITACPAFIKKALEVGTEENDYLISELLVLVEHSNYTLTIKKPVRKKKKEQNEEEE